MEKTRTFTVTYEYTTTTEIADHWVENAIIHNPLLVVGPIDGITVFGRWELVDFEMEVSDQ